MEPKRAIQIIVYLWVEWRAKHPDWKLQMPRVRAGFQNVKRHNTLQDREMATGHKRACSPVQAGGWQVESA
jgi:hypothetical protein